MASTDKCTYVYEARATDLGFSSFCTSMYLVAGRQRMTMAMAMVLLLLLLLLLLMPASLFTLSLHCRTC